jgi:signal transduction histidine kinase
MKKMLLSILQNLISNALRHQEEKITVSAKEMKIKINLL